MYIRQSLKSYLDQLASESPTPGGGSASAVVASLGASLILMAARIAAKKVNVRIKRRIQKAISNLNQVRKNMNEIIDLDARVYRDLIKNYRLAKKKPDQASRKRVETALANCFRLQADLALLVLMAKEILFSLKSFVKGSIASDFAVAHGFLDGAFRGAVQTAGINLVYMKSSKKAHFARALQALVKKYAEVKI